MISFVVQSFRRWKGWAVVSVAVAVIGCNSNDQAKWDSFWGMKGGKSAGGSARTAGERETWTVECNEYVGATSDEMADRMAAALKRVPDLDSNKVWVEHGKPRSRVFYGEYDLEYVETRVENDAAAKGDVVIQLSNEIKTDLEFIRKLAMGDQYPFFSARPVPRPVEDVGPEEWNLRNARGVYTLHIGVTYNTATLHNYKEAAIEWVKDLRKRGFEAYYYHDPEEPQSSICVGTFGEDAMIDQGDGRMVYSQAVKDLRSQEEFKYNLENGHIISRWAVNEDGKRGKIPNWSFLAKIPGRDGQMERLSPPPPDARPPR